MARTKLSVFVALGFFFAIACALVYPNTKSTLTSEDNPVYRVIHKVLFLSGPLEVLGNFLLFVPVLFALIHIAPKVRVRYLALICCFGSATVEIAQTWIPGRVSSMRDFISNSLGIALTVAIMTSQTRFTQWVRGV